MPSDPSLDDLKAAILAKLQSNLHQPAGSASPVALRALDALKGMYPKDATGVTVEEMDWTRNPNAFTEVIGATRVRSPKRIYLNPFFTALSPQPFIEESVAHELEHVRQLQDGPPKIEESIREMDIPYWQRPSEIAARRAAQAYGQARGWESLSPALPARTRKLKHPPAKGMEGLGLPLGDWLHRRNPQK